MRQGLSVMTSGWCECSPGSRTHRSSPAVHHNRHSALQCLNDSNTELASSVKQPKLERCLSQLASNILDEWTFSGNIDTG